MRAPRNGWLAGTRSCSRTRDLKPNDVRLWILIEEECRRGPGCQFGREKMGRVLDLSIPTISRSLGRLRRTKLMVEFDRPGGYPPLPPIRVTFHPYHQNAIARGRSILNWHGRDRGREWRDRAQNYLNRRTRQIEAARLSVRRAHQKRPAIHHPAAPPLRCESGVIPGARR